MADDPMQLSEASKEFTRNEWREFGFFYSSDDERKLWELVGSRSGLLRFAEYLREYCEFTKNEQLSEHEHFGPHFYLKVTTAESAALDRHAISGTLADIQRLAELVEHSLAGAHAGETEFIGKQYVATAEYELALVVKEDAFDPSSVDPQLK